MIVIKTFNLSIKNFFKFFCRLLGFILISVSALCCSLLSVALLGCSEFSGDVLALLGYSECPELQDGLTRTVSLGEEDAQPIILWLQIPTLGWTAFKISGARARENFLFFLYLDAIPYHRQKKKVATGKSGARADPHPHITAHFPKSKTLRFCSNRKFQSLIFS